MENNVAKISEVLNDLLRINNDRIEGYEKASKETDDVDLKALFTSMAAESRIIATELTREIRNYGGDPDYKDTTSSGKIYRVWMDVKATFAGNDRKSVLNACEFGEDAAQKAYKDALESDDLNASVRSLIQNQKNTLRKSHDLIKKERDVEVNYAK
jgi:uncharacterized protein (TIGR02284 family)